MTTETVKAIRRAVFSTMGFEETCDPADTITADVDAAITKAVEEAEGPCPHGAYLREWCPRCALGVLAPLALVAGDRMRWTFELVEAVKAQPPEVEVEVVDVGLQEDGTKRVIWRAVR